MFVSRHVPRKDAGEIEGGVSNGMGFRPTVQSRGSRINSSLTLRSRYGLDGGSGDERSQADACEGVGTGEPDQDIGIEQNHRARSEARGTQLAHVGVDIGHVLALAPYPEERVVLSFLGRLDARGFGFASRAAPSFARHDSGSSLTFTCSITIESMINLCLGRPLHRLHRARLA